MLEDYLEIRPEQEPRLRRAIEAGRILIGPWYVMPDEFLVSGESLIVRNLRAAIGSRAEFGTPMPVGYLPDLFGHVAQMPQIWRQFGLDNTILWRGFGGRERRVLVGGARRLARADDAPAAGGLLQRDAHRLRPRRDDGARRRRRSTTSAAARATGQALLMNGVDHVEPHTAIPELVERLSAIRRSARDALDAAGLRRRGADVGRARPARRSRRSPASCAAATDYANLLPGVLSARVYLKQQNAHVQTLLESYAEPLSVFASLARARAIRAGELRHAWKTLLQNHPHDSICGCSIDAVHEENMTRFARARQVGDAVVDSRSTRSPTRFRTAAAGVAPRRRRQHRRRSSARRSSRRSSTCRSTARSRGARSTRRRSIAR